MAANPITILLFPDTEHTEPEENVKMYSGNTNTTWYNVQQDWGYNDGELFSIRVRKIDGTYMQLGEIPEMPYVGMGEFIQDLGYMDGTGRNGHVFQTVVQPTPTTITVSVYNKAGDTLIHTFDDVYSDSTISTLINSGNIPGVTELSTTINGTALSTDTVLVDGTSYYDVTPVPQTYIKKIYHENQEYIVGAGGDSSDITYDNTESGMTADNVQDAIDELQDSIDGLSNNKYIESADSSNYKVSVVSTLPSTQVTNTIYIVTG